jgi:hypothetical protein
MPRASKLAGSPIISDFLPLTLLIFAQPYPVLRRTIIRTKIKNRKYKIKISLAQI